MQSRSEDSSPRASSRVAHPVIRSGSDLECAPRPCKKQFQKDLFAGKEEHLCDFSKTCRIGVLERRLIRDRKPRTARKVVAMCEKGDWT